MAYRFVRKQIFLFYRERHGPVRLGAVSVKSQMEDQQRRGSGKSGLRAGGKDGI